jgi:hypothetical protein
MNVSVLRDLPDEERWKAFHTLRKQDMIARIARHEQIQASKKRAEWLNIIADRIADRLAMHHTTFIDVHGHFLVE